MPEVIDVAQPTFIFLFSKVNKMRYSACEQDFGTFAGLQDLFVNTKYPCPID